jgi:hypothetical protein
LFSPNKRRRLLMTKKRKAKTPGSHKPVKPPLASKGVTVTVEYVPVPWTPEREAARRAVMQMILGECPNEPATGSESSET